ncbi:MAG: polyphosphate kinase 2 family protein, partial [Pseudomonadota bacterium]|nr:polyphosphate kinase 2 family protein [Pseudomonadota bacterium]
AYEQAINETSTDFAPWYVIPADSKTNRNLLIAKILKAKLEALNMDYPTPPEHYKDIVIED